MIIVNNDNNNKGCQGRVKFADLIVIIIPDVNFKSLIRLLFLFFSRTFLVVNVYFKNLPVLGDFFFFFIYKYQNIHNIKRTIIIKIYEKKRVREDIKNIKCKLYISINFYFLHFTPSKVIKWKVGTWSERE